MGSHINPTFWNGRRVLLTGHTGFKGSWLTVWLLKLGAHVTGISLEPEAHPNLFDELALSIVAPNSEMPGKLTHHIVDIRNDNQLTRIIREIEPEVVLHMAAQSLVRRSFLHPVSTWSVNVIGTLNLLRSLETYTHPCVIVSITTDKVYRNTGCIDGYQETDQLGGDDPYSASKTGVEIAVSSWRTSFCGNLTHQTPYLGIATARAGNVIGGGDWAEDRLVPDAVRSLTNDVPILIRNPGSTRPWQHVLEPLSGYLVLAERLFEEQKKLSRLETSDAFNRYASAFNFGPSNHGIRTVQELTEQILSVWPGSWEIYANVDEYEETQYLNLISKKAHQELGWDPSWDFETTVERTITWYKNRCTGRFEALDACLNDIDSFTTPTSTA